MNEPAEKIPDPDVARLKDMANAVRFLSADAVERAQSGHPGMPMGMAEVAAVLFGRHLRFDPDDPDWPDRDRFVLSAGHGSMLLYALLHLAGYRDMSLDELRRFRQLGSLTAGHPEYGRAPGIETTTGPLGQGITTAVGMAIAERVMQARFGDRLVDHRTWVLAGDGCLMEGISHEAISLAGHLRLSKLAVLWDDNSVCIDGPTDLAVSDDQPARFRASGWQVFEVDAHDIGAVDTALARTRDSDRPTLIACRSTIGFGAPNMAGTAAVHGAPLGADELDAARAALGWPHGPFDLPRQVRENWLASGRRCRAAYTAWQSRLAAAGEATRREFARVQAGEFPEGWEAGIRAVKQDFAQGQPKLATRQASGIVLEAITPRVPEMIGGSADLTGSVNTKTPATVPIHAGDFSGRYIHYGVREHAMAAVMNGIALHGGLVPYGGTFLVFADYMRGAMRLSALMGQRVVYVLTHDSIGLGEDGPTHQPVETLAMLRATPNFLVLRPADAVETAECWEIALRQRATPSGIVLSRQGLPALRTDVETNRSERGAYVLTEAACGPRDVTLIATGSEVSLAAEAREMLEARGLATAVVSAPCFELFERQDDAYRDRVLGRVTLRVGIEAAVCFGWERYIGEDGIFIGMRGFGASAPAPALFEHFAITPQAVVDAVVARTGHR